jgi:hypothetical protein
MAPTSLTDLNSIITKSKLMKAKKFPIVISYSFWFGATTKIKVKIHPYLSVGTFNNRFTTISRK